MELEALKREVTTELSPLDDLLRRPYVPKRRVSGIVRHPNPPSRMEVVDYVIAKYGYCPLPEMEIEYRTIFIRQTVPLAGKLFVDCGFIDCDFEISKERYAVVGSVASKALAKHVSRYGFATLLYNMFR